MAMTDPIADMLTRIRNASKAKHKKVTIPYSRVKNDIAKIMQENGFVAACEIVDQGNNKKEMVIDLKYTQRRQNVIYGLKRISKCGRRHYVAADNIPLVQGGLGVAVMSTPKGIITDKQARKENVGGEVLCYVW